jgi:hypothetical protein
MIRQKIAVPYCSVGTKIDVKVLFAVFYSSVQRVLFPTN